MVQITMSDVKGVDCSDEPTENYQSTLQFAWALQTISASYCFGGFFMAQCNFALISIISIVSRRQESFDKPALPAAKEPDGQKLNSYKELKV